MKKSYVKPEERKKILLLGDDLRSPSGVGTQCKNIILSTCHHYNWVQVAAAQKHPEAGKRLDLSKSINNEAGIDDSNIILYPNNGYGDAQMMRKLLEVEKPDAILFFTDPRYYIWLFQMEAELRKKLPLIYYNIWDDTPNPHWNRPYYRSCDQLLCISKQTKNLVDNVLKDYKKEPWQVKYVPHGIRDTDYYPISQDKHPEQYGKMQQLKKEFFGEDEPEFVVFYNSRNIRRKNTSDIILAWRMFTDFLPKEKAKKCKLILHTKAQDPNGTDLYEVTKSFCDPEQNPVIITNNHISTEQLNILYNISDCHMFMSDNEGWGLGLTESLTVGRMIIAPVQGGMQDQMRFQDGEGNWVDFTPETLTNADGVYHKCGVWAQPMFPDSRSVKGSIKTPYIFASQVSTDTAVKALAEVYAMGKEERLRCGAEGRKFALEELSHTKLGENIMSSIDECLDNWTPRPNFVLLDTDVKFNTYQEYPIKLKSETKQTVKKLLGYE